MQCVQASEGREYSTLSEISFHLRAAQDDGEEYVVSPSRVGGLSSAWLTINASKWSNLRRKVSVGCPRIGK